MSYNDKNYFLPLAFYNSPLLSSPPSPPPSPPLLPPLLSSLLDQSYDQGLWLICFETEYELGKFESALRSMWEEEFQISLQFSQVTDVVTRQRAHKAVELMQGSKFRSDSMTKGRTEFTYSSRY